jgi:hypothetical protein
MGPFIKGRDCSLRDGGDQLCQRSIWMSLGTLQILWIPFWWNSIEGNSCIPAEFEFHSKFHWNCFVNLAGPSAKIDSSVILGIAWIPPESVEDNKDLCVTYETLKCDSYVSCI